MEKIRSFGFFWRVGGERVKKQKGKKCDFREGEKIVGGRGFRKKN